MIKSLLFIPLIIFSLQAYGQADEALQEMRANFQINDYFKAGSYLIFDCWRGYYTCVDEDGYKLCGELRQQDMDKKKSEYSCAPLKNFPTKTACAKKNYEVVEAVAKKRFCYPK